MAARPPYKIMPLAAEITGTITSVLSISLLSQAFSNDLVCVFQVNFWRRLPTTADQVAPEPHPGGSQSESREGKPFHGL